MSFEAIIRQVGDWALTCLPLPPDLVIRAARRGDTPALFALERHNFPMFQGPERHPGRAVHGCPNGHRTLIGYLLKVVAEREGVLVGYALAEVRNWGELYLIELASNPLPPGRKVPGLGLAFLGIAARLATLLGRHAVTVNVCRLDRSVPALREAGYDSDVLVAHYGRAGLRQGGERGLLFGGEQADRGDAWLSATPAEILRTFGVEA